MAFTCGSGVTACILGLANSIISGKKPIIYDGSWAEYGLNKYENINKIKNFFNNFFIAIFAVIAARHFIGFILKKNLV